MTASAKPEVPPQVALKICERLSDDPDLRLPFSFTGECGSSGVSKDVKQGHLLQLMKREPSIFLERYGKLLDEAELKGFQCFSGDYEVDAYLCPLLRSYTGEGKLTKAIEKKNRRLAKLNRMVATGDYFEMESMRHRAPLLYHQYIGQYNSDEFKQRSKATTLWESILENLDEADYKESLQKEMTAEDVMEGEDALAQLALEKSQDSTKKRFGGMNIDEMIEEEEEEEEEEEDHQESTAMATDDDLAFQKKENAQPSIPDEDMHMLREEFVQLMKERFLSGADSQFVDYNAIDMDISLDDDWHEEISRDLEEKYFDE